jgi:hypothetical protein
MTDIIFNGAPKPRLIDGELQLDENLIQDVTTSVDREQKNVQAQLDFKRKSLAFNNSSYSGTDIKVLVHKYGTPTVDLRGDIDRAVAVYSQVQETILTLATKTIPTIGSLAIQLRKGEITSLAYQIALEEYKQYVAKVHTLEGSIKDTGFMQFIGTSLGGRLVDAQKNPEALSREFIRTFNFIQDLLAGWRNQAEALQTRAIDLVSTKVLAELQTLSVSTFREKTAVRACGTVGVKGYTRGTRTVAGSMIFTVFDRNVLFDLLETTAYDADDQFRASIKDQLPPLDITISFANEYGALSRMGLYGVEFVSEGQTMSIEDIILEDVCQFVARDVDPLTPVVNEQGEPYNIVLANYNQAVALGRGGIPASDLRASDLRGSEWDKQPGSESAAVDRFKNRQNPFF